MWLSAVGSPQPPDDKIIMNSDHKWRTAHDRPAAGRPISEHSPARRRTSEPIDELHICVHCPGRLVHPVDWAAEGPSHWRVFLRCPDCEAIREGLFTQPAIDALADELDRGSGVLIRALDALTRENMTAEIDVLIRALDEDLILPCDF
jgi:hypothetical protein